MQITSKFTCMVWKEKMVTLTAMDIWLLRCCQNCAATAEWHDMSIGLLVRRQLCMIAKQPMYDFAFIGMSRIGVMVKSFDPAPKV